MSTTLAYIVSRIPAFSTRVREMMKAAGVRTIVVHFYASGRTVGGTYVKEAPVLRKPERRRSWPKPISVDAGHLAFPRRPCAGRAHTSLPFIPFNPCVRGTGSPLGGARARSRCRDARPAS